MITLGLNAAFHDSSAALVRDGVVLAAVEEERFTRVKHGKRPLPFTAWELPFHAVDYCLAEAGVALADVDHVAYSFDPRQFASEATLASETVTLPLQPSAHALPALLRPAPAFGGAGTDKVALHVRQASQNGNHQATIATAILASSPREGYAGAVILWGRDNKIHGSCKIRSSIRCSIPRPAPGVSASNASMCARLSSRSPSSSSTVAAALIA